MRRRSRRLKQSKPPRRGTETSDIEPGQLGLDLASVASTATAVHTAAQVRADGTPAVAEHDQSIVNCEARLVGELGETRFLVKKLDHFSMDSYPFGGEHARSIGNEIRVVLAIDRTKTASTPPDRPGSVTGDDLAAIKAWTEAWQASGAAENHPAEPADKDDD